MDDAQVTDTTGEIQARKWYYKQGAVFLILLCIGPLGIPFLLRSSEFSKKWKVIIASVVVLITIYATIATIEIGKTFHQYYQMLMS